MFVAKMGDYVVGPGIEIEITQLEDFKFRVLEVQKDKFQVQWLAGTNDGATGFVTYALFEEMGQTVELIEHQPGEHNPNLSFLIKKLEEKGS